MIFTEAYVYKKPITMIAIEKAFKDFKQKYDGFHFDKEQIKKYKSDEKFNKKFHDDANRLCITIYKNIIKEFNFGLDSNVAIELTPEVNMWTTFDYIDPNKFDLSEFDKIITVLPDNRIRLSSKDILSANIQMTTGMVLDLAVTPAMCTASLLHEIGHIFSNPFFKLSFSLDMLERFTDPTDDFNKSKENYSKLSKVKLKNLKNYTNNNYDQLIYNPFNYSHESEKFADFFSSYYGYSEELAAIVGVLFDKWGEKSPKKDASVLSKIGWDLLHSIGDLSSSYYPVPYNRINFLMNALRLELKRNPNLDEKNKKLLNEKIKRITEQLKTMYAMDNANSVYSKLRNYYANTKIGKEKDVDNHINNNFEKYVDFYAKLQREAKKTKRNKK